MDQENQVIAAEKTRLQRLVSIGKRVYQIIKRLLEIRRRIREAAVEEVPEELDGVTATPSPAQTDDHPTETIEKVPSPDRATNDVSPDSSSQKSETDEPPSPDLE